MKIGTYYATQVVSVVLLTVLIGPCVFATDQKSASAKNIERVDDLIELLLHKPEENRSALSYQLARLIQSKPDEVTETHIDGLISILDSPESSVSFWIAKALGSIGGRAVRATGPLIELYKKMECNDGDLTSSDAYITRQTYREALENIGSAQTTPDCISEIKTLLSKAKTESSNSIKAGFLERAKQLIRHEPSGHIDNELIRNLIAFLDNSSDGVRYEAAASLGYIGPIAKDAIPALEKIFREGECGADIWTAADVSLAALGKMGVKPEIIKNCSRYKIKLPSCDISFRLNWSNVTGNREEIITSLFNSLPRDQDHQWPQISITQDTNGSRLDLEFGRNCNTKEETAEAIISHWRSIGLELPKFEKIANTTKSNNILEPFPK